MGRGMNLTTLLDLIFCEYKSVEAGQAVTDLYPGAVYMQVRERCRKEWGLFQTRMAEAEKAYYEMMGVTPPNVTFVSQDKSSHVKSTHLFLFVQQQLFEQSQILMIHVEHT